MSTIADSDPRAVVARELDDAAVRRSSSIHLLYRDVISAQAHSLTGLDLAIDRLPQRFAAVVPSNCDDIGALVRMAGIPVRQTVRDPGLAACSPILVAGCSRELRDYLPDDFFDRGGVLITSDRTILDVPLPAGLITTLPPAAPRAVRIGIAGEASSIPHSVRLAAGHIPVRIVNPCDPRVHVIATAHTSGEPIVVAVHIGNGWLLHSVAHWYQDDAPFTRFVIDRASPPGEHAPKLVRLGLDDAIRAMSLSLLRGLHVVFAIYPEISER